ncbi:glutamine synthetase family protein [Streptomyces sp. NPDC059787]|uniref:glutamine synthetase family protein n=1 Tax=Streptomyces sp. NPDC059787 TaxID=3346947 RepID=UPI00364937F6
MNQHAQNTENGPWPTGTVSLDELKGAVARGEITTVRLAVPDMQGRLKGKILNASVFLDRMLSKAEMCAYVLATDIDMTPLGGFDLTGWEQGYGDMGITADQNSIRLLPHQPGTALVLADAFHHDGKPVEVAPRRILRTQLARLAELGFEVRVGLESEFLLCKGLQPVVPHNLDYALTHPPLLTEFFRQVEDALRGAGTPVESIKTEGAPGQVEITFPYGPALEACDAYTVYKHTVRYLAQRQVLTASFMAAPFTGVGSGMHLHVSLWQNGTSAFATSSGTRLPEVMRYGIAGLLSGMPHLAPLYAPFPNSYKRHATPHSFAPQHMNWGYDNRGCAVRVTGHGDSTHLEVRLPGADANPYLALAASLAAITHGVTEKLTPPDPCLGDAYEDRQAPPVRRDLAEALAYFDGSTLAQSLLGDEVVRHYARAAQAEITEHSRQVTDVEREREFDRA